MLLYIYDKTFVLLFHDINVKSTFIGGNMPELKPPLVEELAPPAPAEVVETEQA